MMTMDDPDARQLAALIASVPRLDERAMDASRQRQDQLTKPPGSLGRLERLATQLAGVTGSVRPRLPRKAIIVMAADHGVVSEGVSAYPAEVTMQMVMNFAGGGAAINVLARQTGARVVVVDIGVASELPSSLPIVHRKIENSHRPDRGKNGFSHHKRAIPRYLRFSQKFVAILEKLPCQFFGFSLKTSTEPQNTPLNPHAPKNPMPPKVDPYATPVQRRIDALLIVIIAITVAILLLTGSRGHAVGDSANSDLRSVQNASR